MNIRIETLTRRLRHGGRTSDVCSFLKWERHEIDTAQCIREFREHNKIDDRFTIIEDDFIEWLNSLGYRRYDG